MEQLQIQYLRRAFGLSEAKARLLAALVYGGGKND